MKTTKRRLLSLFMAMVMVFSLLPTALAEGEGEQPGEPTPCEHEWETTEEKAATCTEAGSKTLTCKKCKESKTEPGESALGHDWTEYVVTLVPTCTTPGKQTRTCRRTGCNASQEENIPMKEHTYGAWTVEIEGNCTTDKKEVRTCGVCQHKDEKITKAPGHTKPDASGYTKVDDENHVYVCTACQTAIPEKHTFDATNKCICGAVKPVQETTLKLNRTTLNLSVGDTATLSATITPDAPLTWENTYDTIASITRSADGKSVTVKALRAGTTTITVSGGGKSATCRVTVGGNLEVTPTKATLTHLGDEATFTAKFNGSRVRDVEWDCANPKYIDLKDNKDGSATISALATTPSGGTTITATYWDDSNQKYTASANVVVSYSAKNVATVTVYNSTDSYNLDDPDDDGDDSIVEQMEDYFDDTKNGYYGLASVEFNSRSDTYGSLSATTGREYDVDGSSNSKYDISDVTFSPSSTKTGTATFDVTANVYRSNGKTTTPVSCTISFKVVDGKASGGDVEYTASLGEDVQFRTSDFEDFWDDAYSRGELESVSFKVSGGTLRDSDGKTVGSKECYASPTRNQIDLDGVYFEPNSATSKKAGTVKFSFTATGYARNSSKSTTRTGTVSITYMGGSPKDITYTVNANGSVNLKASDFTAAYKEATGSTAPSGMTIVLQGVPRNGTLTYTDSSKSKPTDVKLTSSNIKNRSFTTRSSGTNQINDVSYSGNSGTDTIEYIAYSGNSAQFTGKIVFNGAPTAPTNLSVTFTSTNGAAATLSSAAFTTANATVMGKTYRLRFTAPTNGSLLLNGATTAVGVDIFPSSLGSVSYRPKAGFNGSDKCLFMAYDASGNLTGSGTVNFVVVGNPANTTTPGTTPGASSISQFKDVPATAWYRTELADLVSKGIIKGKSATSFAPRDNVTYGEALKMVLRAAGHTAEEGTGNNWAINYKNLAVSKGWISNDIVLTNAISRAAMADLVAKVLGVASSGAASPFADTANGYAIALYNTTPRIFNGETGKDGKLYFNGGDSLKREQICAVIYRVNQYYTNANSNQMPDGI